MSDRINSLINNIREKSIHLNEKLSIQEEKNNDLETQLNSLREELNSQKKENEQLSMEMMELKENKKANNEQSISNSGGNDISDEKIDELVKEIEYCIGQLKK